MYMYLFSKLYYYVWEIYLIVIHCNNFREKKKRSLHASLSFQNILESIDLKEERKNSTEHSLYFLGTRGRLRNQDTLNFVVVISQIRLSIFGTVKYNIHINSHFLWMLAQIICSTDMCHFHISNMFAHVNTLHLIHTVEARYKEIWCNKLPDITKYFLCTGPKWNKFCIVYK